MSAIDLDVLKAFSEALNDNLNYNPSGHEIAEVLMSLGDAGFHVTRKPEQVIIGDWNLSVEDSRKFIDALLNPPEPNDALKAAAATYKAAMGLTPVPAAPSWPPSGVDKLWVKSGDEATLITDRAEFVFAVTHDNMIVESGNRTDALMVLNDSSIADSRCVFAYEDQHFDFPSYTLPF